MSTKILDLKKNLRWYLTEMPPPMKMVWFQIWKKTGMKNNLEDYIRNGCIIRQLIHTRACFVA